MRLPIITIAIAVSALAFPVGAPAQERRGAESEIDEALRLNDQAVDLLEQGRYDAAEPLFVRALQIRERALGQEHPAVAASLNNLASLHKAKGNYARAERLFLRALVIEEKALGSEHPLVATSLNNLALLYEVKGDYARAEPLYQRALRILEKVHGPEHPDVASSLNNLAMLYYAKGDYVAAEPLHQKALRIREKALGPEHPDVASSLNNLAMLYYTKGDYARAEPLYQRALRIREKALGSNHPDLATSLNNLATLFYAKGYAARAEPLFERALRISEKVLGPEHPGVATSLNNLGGLYEVKGDYALAEPLLERALRILEKALGPDHPDVATSLNNLAELYSLKKDYARAEPLFERTLHILEQMLGPEHPSVATTLNNLAGLYEAQRSYVRAVEMRRRAANVEEHNLIAILAAGAEEQKQAYFDTLAVDTDLTVLLHVRSAPTLPAAARLSLTTILRRKGRVLEAMRDLFQTLRQNADAKDLARIDELARLRTEVAKRTLRGPDQGETTQAHLQRLGEMREAARQIEETLASRYHALGVKQIQITFEAVQAALPHDTALVEYFVFEPFDAQAAPGARWGKPRYVAYVLRPKGEPSWVDLGEAEPIDRLAREVRSGYAAGDRKAARPARELDRAVMEPVRKLLGATTKVFLSPDGELNLVPFGALTDEHGDYLVKRYRFTYLSSGRDLLRMSTQG